MFKKNLKLFLLFMLILYFLFLLSISLTASEQSFLIQSHQSETVIYDFNEYITPLQNTFTNKIVKQNTISNKVLLSDDDIANTSLFLFNVEKLNSLLIFYHNNIDGLYSYFLQRIII